MSPIRHATPSEGERAIFLDLEGFMDCAPALAGWKVDGRFRQIVLDPKLRPAAEVRGIESSTGRAFFAELEELARRERRRVCAFTRHELNVARDHFGVDLGACYLDGHKLAKRWWNRLRPCERPTEWSLEAFEKCLGLERPRILGAGHASQRLRHVRDQLERRGSWRALTPTAKGKWTKLLSYNRLDVEHLEALVSRAARDLAGA